MGSTCTSLLPNEHRYARTRTRSGAHPIDRTKFPPFINMFDKYNFDILGRTNALEEGGTANVVIGTDNNNKDHQVAIKIMPKDAEHGTMETKSLFENEVDILRRMDHENIVKVYDIGQDPNNYYIALQLGHGGDLVGMV